MWLGLQTNLIDAYIIRAKMDSKGTIDFTHFHPAPQNDFLQLLNPPLPVRVHSTSFATGDSPESLQSLSGKSKIPLLTVKSIFWFDFFPDKVIIDQHKVSFIYKDAFGIRSIHSVLIENITYVEASTGLLTGKLMVTDSTNYRVPIDLVLTNLRRLDAIRARKLIQGLMQAKRGGIDLSKFELFELELELENLGQVIGED